MQIKPYSFAGENLYKEKKPPSEQFYNTHDCDQFKIKFVIQFNLIAV